MENTSTTAPKIRRIAPGLYGTGIYRTTRDDCPYGFDADAQVELVIESHIWPDSGRTYWYIEEMLPNGEFTQWSDNCPEPSLRMAKTILSKHINYYID